MSRATAELTLRLRLAGAISAAVALVAVMAAVGALFPAVGHTIGRLDVPKSVSNLLGGADYGTITGWFRSEIGAIYGPLLIGVLAYRLQEKAFGSIKPATRKLLRPSWSICSLPIRLPACGLRRPARW